MVAEVAVATALVVTVKLAAVALAAMVTDAGTDAEVELLDDNVITAPPVGAAAVRVTVPVLLVPPVTRAGLIVTADKAAGAGLTVSTAVLVTLL